MKGNEYITDNLSDFGALDLKEAAKLLEAWSEIKGTKKDFLGSGVKLYLDTANSVVFLMDEDGNTATLNEKGKLEQYEEDEED